MVRWTKIAAVLGAVTLIASACGTTGDNPLGPEGKPAYNGGGFGVGGNVVGDTTTAGARSAEPIDGRTPSDTVGFGGGFGTGGN